MAQVKPSDKVLMMKAGYWVGFVALRDELREEGGLSRAKAQAEALAKVLPLARRKLEEMEAQGVDVEGMTGKRPGAVENGKVRGRELEALKQELAETAVVGGEVVDAPGTMRRGEQKPVDPELLKRMRATKDMIEQFEPLEPDEGDVKQYDSVKDMCDDLDVPFEPDEVEPPALSADREAAINGIVGVPPVPMDEGGAVKAEEFDRQMKWVVAVLERKGSVRADDAPSGMAWAYYRMCKDSVAFREKFLMKMLERMLPRDMSGGGAEDDEDDLGVEKGLVEYMGEVADLARDAESYGTEPETGD